MSLGSNFNTRRRNERMSTITSRSALPNYRWFLKWRINCVISSRWLLRFLRWLNKFNLFRSNIPWLDFFFLWRWMLRRFLFLKRVGTRLQQKRFLTCLFSISFFINLLNRLRFRKDWIISTFRLSSRFYFWIFCNWLSHIAPLVPELPW